MAENKKPIQGLASIGITVAIDGKEMYYVKDIGEIGGKPSSLESTCMTDTMTHSSPGIKEAKEFAINYYYDASEPISDYRVLKGIENKKEIVPLVITFPDGAVYATTGYITSYISGTKVNELIGATCTVNLQSDWTETYPTESN